MRKLFLPLLLVFLLAAGIGGGYFGGRYLHPPPPAPLKADTPPPDDKGKPPNADLLYDLPDMLIALSGDPDPSQVLALSISVRCASQGDLDKLQEYLPRVLDAYQGYLRTLSLADLRGTEHLAALKVKLMERTNAVIAPGKVSAVMIRSLVIH